MQIFFPKESFQTTWHTSYTEELSNLNASREAGKKGKASFIVSGCGYSWYNLKNMSNSPRPVVQFMTLTY